MQSRCILGKESTEVDRGKADEEQSGKNTHAYERTLFLVHRQVTHQTTRLAVHGKEELLAFPDGTEHPDGHERIDRISPVFLDFAAIARNVVIAFNRVLERLAHARIDALFRTSATGLSVLVVAVCHKSRHIGHRVRHKRTVVERLDGIHVGIGHLARAIHWNTFKGYGALTLNVEVIGLDNLVIALIMPTRTRGFKGRGARSVGIHEPEGNVNALDFFDSVAAGKTLGKQHLALVVLGQCTLGRLAIKFERNHKIGTEIS